MMAQVIFHDDGTSAKLGADSLSVSEYAEVSDDDDDDDESYDNSLEGSESLDDDEEQENRSAHQGIGFLEATSVQGVQTETALFAKWEHHTRGIASKMMASMGYRSGTGLGVSGQGIVDPIPVKVLPKGQSLDHAFAFKEAEEDRADRGKKRSRGGKRRRDKKFAEAARAAKITEGESLNVFSFINGLGSKAKKCTTNKRKEDRRSLVAYDNEVNELRIQVEKLEEMASRNRKDKVVFEAASRRLTETRKALVDAEATRATASNAVVSKEKEKKWLKF